MLSVLQCVAVCCSVLQCVAVCCSVLQCVAVYCRLLDCECSLSIDFVFSILLMYSSCCVVDVFSGMYSCCAFMLCCCFIFLDTLILCIYFVHPVLLMYLLLVFWNICAADACLVALCKHLF